MGRLGVAAGLCGAGRGGHAWAAAAGERAPHKAQGLGAGVHVGEAWCGVLAAQVASGLPAHCKLQGPHGCGCA